jgi:hypothetical protein
MEPPVPAGLRELSAPLDSLIEFLGIDEDLVEVAASASAPLKAGPSRKELSEDSQEVALCYPVRMSQPVKLSDALVLDARVAGDLVERSIAGQVEYWARLGRSVELLLNGQQVMQLCRTGVTPVSELIASVGKPTGKQRLARFLDSQPYPHYRPHPKAKGLLERIDEDGSVTVGRFVNREFKAQRVTRKATAARG